MRRAIVNSEKCDKSPWCPAKRVCPVKAIERESESDPYHVNQTCIGCGACANMCPSKAIRME